MDNKPKPKSKSTRTLSPRSGLRPTPIPAFVKGILSYPPTVFGRSAIITVAAVARKPDLEVVKMSDVVETPVRAVQICGQEVVPLVAQTCLNCANGRRIWLWLKQDALKTQLSRETLSALNVHPPNADGSFHIVLNKMWTECYGTDGNVDIVGQETVSKLGLQVTTFTPLQVALLDHDQCDEQQLETADKLKLEEHPDPATSNSATVTSSRHDQINRVSKVLGTDIPKLPKKSTGSPSVASIIGSSYVPKSVPAAAPKALKLGAKNVSDDAFVQQLRNEGQVISDLSSLSVNDKKRAVVESVNRGPVLIRQSEKLTSIVSRTGGIKSAEIQGNISVNINDPEFTTVTLKVKNGAVQGTQIQVHPNMDKAVWQKQQILKLKSIQKPYPLNGDVCVIRWWLVLSDEEQLPLVLNVFPNETPDGCTVNIEYTLENEALTLQNVLIAIPLPPATQPIVSEAEGTYEYVRSKSQLLWSIPIIDESNSSGNLEFSVPNGHSDHFFPVNVNFESENLVCQIELEDAVTFDGSESVEHTAETAFIVDKYEVV